MPQNHGKMCTQLYWNLFLALLIYRLIYLLIYAHPLSTEQEAVPLGIKLIIQLNTFELELNFAQGIHYTDVQIADFCRVPIYHLPGNVISATVGFVYFEVCSPNLSLARLVSDDSGSLEKLSWGHCPPQLPLRKNFALGLSSCSWLKTPKISLSGTIGFYG